jgi:hypothetical protein
MKITVLIIVLLISLSMNTQLQATTEIVRNPDAWDFAPLLYYDLVVRGTVVIVEDFEVTDADVWMDPPEIAEVTSKNVRTASRVRIKVQDIMRGPELGQTVDIVVPTYRHEYNTRYEQGDEMILCVNYHPRLDSYFLKSTYGKYIFREMKWYCEGNARGDRAFTDSELKKQVMSMSLENVVEESELIIDGTIETVKKGWFEGPDGSGAEMITLGIRIRQIHKGQQSDAKIEVVMLTAGIYLPEWRKHVPKKYVEGQEWLLFLKKGPLGWYPFAGTNGLLRVENNQLIYDERVLFWHNRKSIEEKIEEVVRQ